MLSNQYYHEIIRKTIIAFGTLFNNIEIASKDKQGNTIKQLRVPIAYGPIQKFLARLEERPNLSGPGPTKVGITLPRMSFEMTGIQYDSARKISTLQTFNSVSDTGKLVKNYMPVPYNISMQLNILTKLNDDALQILEQILPYFQPNFTLTVDLVETLGEKRDIPITLENITFDDNYEDDFSTRRNLTYTINFVCKTYLFGPTATTSTGLIKKVQVDYQTDTANLRTGSRQLRYTVTPVATKDYDSDNQAVTAEVVTESVTTFDTTITGTLLHDMFIQIDSEVMKIKNIEGNTLTVLRGQNGTSISQHDVGTAIHTLTQTDDSLIDIDDDFGFSETLEEFADGKYYSTTKRTDV